MIATTKMMNEAKKLGYEVIIKINEEYYDWSVNK
jgi:hypothetical protein